LPWRVLEYGLLGKEGWGCDAEAIGLIVHLLCSGIFGGCCRERKALEVWNWLEVRGL